MTRHPQASVAGALFPLGAAARRLSVVVMLLVVIFAATAWSAFSQARRAEPGREIVALVDTVAARYGVPAWMAHRVVEIESGYRCKVRNGIHAGIMQVKPATARSVGVHGDLTDCTNGLEAGMRYLRLALERGGAGCEGASLYNTGIYARPRCTAYGRKVMEARR